MSDSFNGHAMALHGELPESEREEEEEAVAATE
jgi:hypothetical protein